MRHTVKNHMAAFSSQERVCLKPSSPICMREVRTSAVDLGLCSSMRFFFKVSSDHVPGASEQKGGLTSSRDCPSRGFVRLHARAESWESQRVSILSGGQQG